MFTVYVLRDKYGKYYKGVTGNLDRRIKEHRVGKTKSTKNMESFEVVYTETYQSWDIARGREKYLKSSAGRRYLKKMRV